MGTEWVMTAGGKYLKLGKMGTEWSNDLWKIYEFAKYSADYGHAIRFYPEDRNEYSRRIKNDIDFSTQLEKTMDSEMMFYTLAEINCGAHMLAFATKMKKEIEEQSK